MSSNIGQIFHIIHVVEDFAPVSVWYKDVFGAQTFGGHLTDLFPRWDLEKRDAELLAIANTVVEPMSPATDVEGWQAMPIGRFHKRFGRHWHSLAWYCEDPRAIWESLRAANVQTFRAGGTPSNDEPPVGGFFTHPRDTHGQLQFTANRFEGDPRLGPDWNGTWSGANHPLGVERLAHATIVTSDVDAATSFFVGRLKASVLHRSDSALHGTRSTFVAVGTDTIVELAQPRDGESFAGQDLNSNGEILHALTWKVSDLDRAAAFLETKGVRIAGRDEATIVADPATTFGAFHRFTTVDVPGDPRG